MRVVITQRVDEYPQRGEARDALDQAWARTLPHLAGRAVTLLPLANAPSTAKRTLEDVAPGLIILSGGNDVGSIPVRDETEATALAYATENTIPVLAVCRGMQFVQHYLGGELVRCEGHVAVNHEVRAVSAPQPAMLQVNSYHQWGIRALAEDLTPLYLHADGTIEAVQHATLPWLGVMWHPERDEAVSAESNRWIAQMLSGWL